MGLPLSRVSFDRLNRGQKIRNDRGDVGIILHYFKDNGLHIAMAFPSSKKIIWGRYHSIKGSIYLEGEDGNSEKLLADQSLRDQALPLVGDVVEMMETSSHEKQIVEDLWNKGVAPEVIAVAMEMALEETAS